MLAGIETTAEVFKGIPAPAIIAAARSSQADIIVICSHGYTGATRRVLGSIAEKVAFHAPIPVLVLHEERTALPDARPGIFHPLRTLVALDGSVQAEEAIEPAAYLTAALAAPSQGGLHLMRVVQPDTTNNSTGDLLGSETVLQMASSYLGSVVDRLSEGPLKSASAYLLPATRSVVLDNDVSWAITRAADNGESGAEGGCDIVAIATHGFGELPHGAMESITGHVLKSIRLPLLIVRSLDIMERSNFTWDETALFTI
jgi:nucleotide-binding universal stress UspA family protein